MLDLHLTRKTRPSYGRQLSASRQTGKRANEATSRRDSRRSLLSVPIRPASPPAHRHKLRGEVGIGTGGPNQKLDVSCNTVRGRSKIQLQRHRVLFSVSSTRAHRVVLLGSETLPTSPSNSITLPVHVLRATERCGGATASSITQCRRLRSGGGFGGAAPTGSNSKPPPSRSGELVAHYKETGPDSRCRSARQEAAVDVYRTTSSAAQGPDRLEAELHESSAAATKV